MSLETRYYSLTEASTMVGRQFKAAYGYFGVPGGTIGVVDEIYEMRPNEYGIKIKWLGLKSNIRDGFSRTDMEMSIQGKPAMIEVDGWH